MGKFLGPDTIALATPIAVVSVLFGNMIVRALRHDPEASSGLDFYEKENVGGKLLCPGLLACLAGVRNTAHWLPSHSPWSLAWTLLQWCAPRLALCQLQEVNRRALLYRDQYATVFMDRIKRHAFSLVRSCVKKAFRPPHTFAPTPCLCMPHLQFNNDVEPMNKPK
jgi:hypothetical protein